MKFCLQKRSCFRVTTGCLVLLMSGCAIQKPQTVVPPSSVKQPTQNTQADQRQAKLITATKIIEKSMDPVDQFKREQALTHAGVGQPTNWTNPDSGNQYTITTNKVFTQGAQDCRSYVTIAVINQHQYQAQSTACHSETGGWQLVMG